MRKTFHGYPWSRFRILSPSSWEGTSLRPIIAGATPGLAAFSENAHKKTVKSLRNDTHKYILATNKPHERLYDLRKDPFERTDIAAQDEQVTRKMRLLMRAILRRNAANRDYRDGGGATVSEELRSELDELGYVGGGRGAESGTTDERRWLAVIDRLENRETRGGR